MVLLHNDPDHTLPDVCKALTDVVPDMVTDEAMEITMRTHRTGQCIVRIVPQSLAETYMNGLRQRELVSTIEPM